MPLIFNSSSAACAVKSAVEGNFLILFPADADGDMVADNFCAFDDVGPLNIGGEVLLEQRFDCDRIYTLFSQKGRRLKCPDACFKGEVFGVDYNPGI